MNDVKCYKMIRPQHVNVNNMADARNIALLFWKTERRKPKDHGKSRKACQETTLPLPPPQTSCVICIFIVVDVAAISLRPKFKSSLE